MPPFYYDSPGTGELHEFYAQAPVSYGQAPVSYGQGGAPAIAAAGSLMGGLGQLIVGIAQGVSLARQTESMIVINVADYQDKWHNKIAHINALKRQITNLKAWLVNSTPGGVPRDSDNYSGCDRGYGCGGRRGRSTLKEWRNGHVAHRARRGHKSRKANKRECPTAYLGQEVAFAQVGQLSCDENGRGNRGTGKNCGGPFIAPKGWWGNVFRFDLSPEAVAAGAPTVLRTARPGWNPGGHSKLRKDVTCPTSYGAYKDPAKAMLYRMWLDSAQGVGWGPGETPVKGWEPALSGRGLDWELGWMREAWAYLMALAPAQIVHNLMSPGAERVSISTAPLLDPVTLMLLFPGSNGMPPEAMGRHWWNTYVNIYQVSRMEGGGMFAASVNDLTEIPPWVFGYTEAEARELFPDPTYRIGAFSMGVLYTVMRQRQATILEAHGIYAGTAYGDAGEDGSEFDTALENSPMDSGAMATSGMRGVVEAIAADPSLIGKAKRYPAATRAAIDTAREGSEAQQAQANYIVGLSLGEDLRNQPVESKNTIDTFAVQPDYTPLYVGGAVMAVAATLTFLTGR